MIGKACSNMGCLPSCLSDSVFLVVTAQSMILGREVEEVCFGYRGSNLQS